MVSIPAPRWAASSPLQTREHNIYLIFLLSLSKFPTVLCLQHSMCFLSVACFFNHPKFLPHIMSENFWTTLSGTAIRISWLLIPRFSVGKLFVIWPNTQAWQLEREKGYFKGFRLWSPGPDTSDIMVETEHHGRSMVGKGLSYGGQEATKLHQFYM